MISIKKKRRNKVKLQTTHKANSASPTLHMHAFQVSFIMQPKQKQLEQGQASNKTENKVNFPYLSR